MRLAIQEDLFPVKNFNEFLQMARKWELDAVEVWGKGLSDRVDEVQRTLRVTGMPACSICPGGTGIRGSLLNNDEWETTAADIREFLRLGAALNGSAVILVPRFRRAQFLKLYPDENCFLQNKQKFLDRLAPLAREAERLGVTILLEPLNRYEADFLITIDQAAQLCAEIDSPRVRILADLFHMNLEEANISSSLTRNIHWIAHIHLADSNRLLPGLGHLDFPYILRALAAASFTGTLCIECHCPSPNPTEAISRSIAYLRTTAGINHP